MPVMVKAAIFNLLRGHVEGETIVDLFAGVGTMGLEAYSRGAGRVVHVERDKRVLKLLEDNIAALDAGEVCEVLSADALGPLALARLPKQSHLIFSDPPYALVRERAGYERVRAQMTKLAQTLDDTGYLVLRVPRNLMFDAGDATDTPAGGASGGSGRHAGSAASPGGGGGVGKVRLTGDPATDMERLMDERLHDGDDDNHAGGDRLVITSLDDPAWDDVDAFEDELFGADGDEVPGQDDAHAQHTPAARRQGAHPHRVQAELTLPGTIGPEIHSYGDMDVCLYMRAPAAHEPDANG